MTAPLSVDRLDTDRFPRDDPVVGRCPCDDHQEQDDGSHGHPCGIDHFPEFLEPLLEEVDGRFRDLIISIDELLDG